MATPTTPKSIELCTKLFMESLKPIWPSLKKKECRFIYMNKREPFVVVKPMLTAPIPEEWRGDRLIQYAKHPEIKTVHSAQKEA